LLGAFDGRVHLPARCEAYLAGELARTPGPREAIKIAPVLADQETNWQAAREFVSGTIGFGRTSRMSVPFPVAGYLRDGEELSEVPGWEVIHAPGHTDDSTCLYHRDTATLISGDAVLTHEGRAWLNPEIVDPQLAGNTEARLRELDVRHLLPGHGAPIAGRNLLRDARSFREKPAGHGALARIARFVGSW
jgi:glyoxylase-like metal-dependent hydrolase (beta-lactamase superfamily II)